MANADLSIRLELAKRISRLAGKHVMGHYRRPVAVERKSDDSPVTIADREAESLLREEIQRKFPDDAIVGEEHGQKEGTSGYCWILDPIDGTKSFIAGVPLFSTLVAVQHQGESVIGVIELPALDERVYAARGSGAWWQAGSDDPQKAKVSDTHSLRDGLYLTSELETYSEREATQVHTELESRAWYSRTWGDGYGYFLVATGRAAAMVDPIMSIWDAAALLPVIKEAGGRFTDWAGHETVESGEAIATNGHVHEEVLALTRPFASRST